ncbi:phasin family protein [Brevundimonas sp. S30B]|uniref:phasin family protein n=1 Tax=unclassified Brevundimonas TaxID=2622653 RepID=UPI001072C107|nr:MULTISPECIES: TIGR01841 family phasin [unclassified Brevundimonas]QBX38347.1 phasin family protein [Brevundimonas sp. MF30-B]TFW02055.1 phasin family protein [Brevundimonas sp. S30B]
MADATETMKKTVEQTASKTKAQAEQFQAAGAQAFREGVDKSVAGFSELNAQSKRNLEAMVESASAAQKGAEALSQQALAFSKKSWEDNMAAAQSMATARSIQELVELQTSWAKSASEAYLSEMTRMTETLTASVKDSFKPINERVTASVETLQAAR